MSVQLDTFISKTGIYKITLEEQYIHGTQTWFIRSQKADGETREKPYLDPRTAKTDFETLREKLCGYEREELD